MFSRPHVFTHVDVPFAQYSGEYLEVFDLSPTSIFHKSGIPEPSPPRLWVMEKEQPKLRFSEHSRKLTPLFCLIVVNGPLKIFTSRFSEACHGAGGF